MVLDNIIKKTSDRQPFIGLKRPIVSDVQKQF